MITNTHRTRTEERIALLSLEILVLQAVANPTPRTVDTYSRLKIERDWLVSMINLHDLTPVVQQVNSLTRKSDYVLAATFLIPTIICMVSLFGDIF